MYQALKDRKMNSLGSLILMSVNASGREKTFISKYFPGYGNGEGKETHFERRRAMRSGVLAGL